MALTSLRVLLTYLGVLICTCSATVPTSWADAEPGVQEFCTDIEDALAAGRYDELEAAYSDAGPAEKKFMGGNNRLYVFYRALAHGVCDSNLESKSAITIQRHIRLLDSWLKNKPHSYAARAALATAWRSYAWRARGNGPSGKVSPNGRRVFEGRLRKAWSYMSDLDPNDDPQTYMQLIYFARDFGFPRDTIDSIFEAARKAFPSYYNIYFVYADLLQTKWFGKPGEFGSFVTSLMQDQGEDGKIAYSYIAYRMLFIERGKLFHDDGLSWVNVRESYKLRGERYGLRAEDWNALCYMAVVARDIQFAREALSRVGANWDRDVWLNKGNFDEVSAWVLKQ